jgi:hypothetical protein
MTMYRTRVSWTGFPGAPGVSTFYEQTAITLPAKLRTFYEAVKAYLPSNVTLSYASSGDLIDETTGGLTGDWSVTPTPANTVGTLGQVYAAPVGVVVNWRTSGIVNGHRVRGRTFLVPVQQDTATGVPNPTAIAAIQAAATALVAAAPNMCIWARPVLAPLPHPRAGSAHAVTAAAVPGKYVVLRSRRD